MVRLRLASFPLSPWRREERPLPKGENHRRPGREETMATTVTLPGGLSAGEVREAVQRQYSSVAHSPDGSYTFRVGRAFAEALGYPAAILDQLPPSAWEAFTG